MLNFDVLSPLRFKLLHDFQKLVVRLFPIFQAIFQVSQVTQRVLFSRGVVDCPLACCDRLVTREREPWLLLSVAKRKEEKENPGRTRFISGQSSFGVCSKGQTNARNAHVQIFPQPIGAFFGFSSDSFFSNLKYI